MGTVTRFPKENLRLSPIPLIDDDASARYERTMLATSENSLRWIASWFATCGSDEALDKFGKLITDIALDIAVAANKRLTEAERRGDL